MNPNETTTQSEHNGNGHNGHNGHQANGLIPAMPDSSPAPLHTFDQPVILRQSNTWSRAIIWSLVGVTTLGIAWSFIAEIDEAVPALGKLEPSESVKEIKAPIGGVVQEVVVKEGETVKKGQVLLRLDATTADESLKSLETVRDSLVRENAYYQAQMTGSGGDPSTAATLPVERAALTRNRSTLQAELQLYRMNLYGTGSMAGLNAEEQSRLQATRLESSSRANAAQLEVSQLQSQLAETQSQLVAARDLLDVDRKILTDFTQLSEEGALARVQTVRQQQQTRSREAEVERLQEQVARIQAAIAQSQERVQNTVAISLVDGHNRVAENEKRIAEIDSQLNKIIVDNLKRIAEVEGQLAQARVNLKYQEITAPIDGKVFDLKPTHSGYVINDPTPLVKVVPTNALEARVFITNKDIGFVREQMDVDIRIDSFPFSEFGDIKGKLTFIASDALPPDNIHPYYRFPATVQLDRQNLSISGRQVSLQSGMALSANIRTRKRKVISLFTDLFAQKVDSLQQTR
ncbi:MAG: HlyD family efflux transporter periplasmic adaptor subunit [Oscillatoriales cyanobacterium SM2_2_1]|nr:HlyD family efflux transporter periplasmic adaptor subunit [Oscillatoriales cyanobacterium SM2_2_1]